jgi:hypothetical protein
MSDCMFLAGDDCPATMELKDMDRQINLRMKADAENVKLRDALHNCMMLAVNSDPSEGCRLIIKKVREALE